MDYSQLWDVILFILGVALLWVILRFLLRLTARLFGCGCIAILLLGLLLALLGFWNP